MRAPNSSWAGGLIAMLPKLPAGPISPCIKLETEIECSPNDSHSDWRRGAGDTPKDSSFPGQTAAGDDDLLHMKEMGVEHMLLALSMELALKAWFVFDFDDPRHSKSHDLDKLLSKLKSESQEKQDQEFKRSVAPYHPNFL